MTALSYLLANQCPSENGSSLERKNLLPTGINSFLLEKNHFQKRIMYRGANRKSEKLSTLYTMAENPASLSSHLETL